MFHPTDRIEDSGHSTMELHLTSIYNTHCTTDGSHPFTETNDKYLVVEFNNNNNNNNNNNSNNNSNNNNLWC